MESAAVLVSAMAENCREQIHKWVKAEYHLPKALQAAHLDWMCGQVIKHAETWTMTKLHRWIGFIECGMLANRMIDSEGIKEMFGKAKVAFSGPSEDLVDHLDLGSEFELELGGSG